MWYINSEHGLIKKWTVTTEVRVLCALSGLWIQIVDRDSGWVTKFNEDIQDILVQRYIILSVVVLDF